MDQTQRGVATDSNNLSALSSSQMPHVLFREIHKNAFLKKHSSDRRAGFPRKSEKVWVVFCVHDDVEAFLEMYPDQKVALTHKPEWFTSLANALHVSASICGHEDEFEFAVTLSTQVIRLAAPSWESMMEWVDTIRNKLRELKVLSPKENLYSKMPEQKQPLLPTRDPNSPLPLPPDGPSTLLPGVEPVHLETRVEPNERHQRGNERRTRHEETREASQPESSHESEPIPNRTRISLNRTVSVPEASAAQRITTSIPTCSNITVIEVSCPRNSHSVSECNSFDYVVDNAQGDADGDDVFVTPPVTPKLIPETSGAHYEHVFLPNAAESSSVSVNANEFKVNGENGASSSHDDNIPSTSAVSDRRISKGPSENGCISQQVQSKLEKVTISGMIPRVPAKSSRSREAAEVPEEPSTEGSSSSPAYSQVKKKGKVKDPRVLSPLPRRKTEEASESGPSTSGNARPSVPITNNTDVEPLTATVQPAVGVIAVEDIPLIGGHQRRRRRSSSSDAATTSANNIARGITGADRIRINVPLTREDGDGRGLDVRNDEHVHATKSSARLTLREQQVLQLRREMMHPGGVRLQLRRKECVSSIALVDVLSGVWVAGWKQREHPMLYNALHIGDQLISVSDVVVRSAAEAQKIIRNSNNIYIELIIRRVPFGRVFALHRSSEGQNLGIVQEGNTAEISDVLPNSVAARAGLSPKTTSMDGLSLTTWFLTEINGRPLNLFFKDNEVRDRLNAVGKDISILVQPHDFIKQIKKNLKNFRSYKDYIVQ
ncbi:UNVERIFIED_CONTAM: hypothetical protein PYX00_007339 [Menopon gallinae]|uniref:PH domain-containing protein n=1 Tax=Menopon gallinae TaxID=328185 RepID=A0AAW2HIM0_9NEOP